MNSSYHVNKYQNSKFSIYWRSLCMSGSSQQSMPYVLGMQSGRSTEKRLIKMINPGAWEMRFLCVSICSLELLHYFIHVHFLFSWLIFYLIALCIQGPLSVERMKFVGPFYAQVFHAQKVYVPFSEVLYFSICVCLSNSRCTALFYVLDLDGKTI
jgi:hypothetical protein